MKIAAQAGREDLAMVYLAEMPREHAGNDSAKATDPGNFVEFVHSLQPPFPRSEKWVLIVSTLFGCPVGCSICDAGGWFKGKVSTEQMFEQIDYMVTQYYPDGKIPAKKFKIQFARMGEPSFNPNVLEVLEQLPQRYHAPGLIPSISTIAPHGTEAFFDRLIEVKNRHYGTGNFQMQFSIHSTDEEKRNRLIPVKKWSFEQMAAYGKRFYRQGDRKITLNFALAEDSDLSPALLLEYFDPERFLIKLTPVNPTVNVIKNAIPNAIECSRQANDSPVVRELREKGYDVIISIGELEENKIGSNCGQYIKTFLDGDLRPDRDTYQYEIKTDTPG